MNPRAGVRLASVGSAPAIGVNVYWSGAEIDCDVVAFGLTPEGGVPADSAFVFYNNPQTPGGLIMIRTSRDPGAGDPCRAQVLIDLAEPSSVISAIRIALATVTFPNLSGLRGIGLSVVSLADARVLARHDLANIVHTSCVVLGDVATDGDAWYFVPGAQPRTDGLAGLATSLGVHLA